MRFKKLLIYSNTFFTINSLFSNLELQTKKQAFFTLVIMLITAFTESFTLLTVVPLITLLIGFSDSKESINIPYLQNTYSYLINNDLNIVIPIFLGLIIISGSLKTLDVFNCSRLTVKASHDLSLKTYQNILRRPYEFHIYGDSSKFLAALTTYIRDTHEFIFNLLRIISSIFILSAVLITLLIISVKITIISAISISFLYLLIGSYTRNKLLKSSMIQVEASNNQTKIVQDSLSTIREIKIWNAYNLFDEKYKQADWKLRVTQRQRMFLGSFPRYLIESFGIVFLVLICIFSKRINTNSTSVIAILGTFALGAQRLLPVLNQVYVGWNYINSFKQSAAFIKQILEVKNPKIKKLDLIKSHQLSSSIVFDGITFKYPKSKNTLFKNLKLNFYKGDIVAIVGKSGEGKSTLIDLLSGMLIPNKGQILIDGIPLHNKSSSEFLLRWRSSLSYVSQNIYLMKGNFFDNIAFGIDQKNIDIERVKYVASLAMLDNFINSLPSNYQSTIFENGKNLSGGQKQRIGIARALYRSDSLLILDEATNALDIETETKIINKIFNSKEKRTIFIISHNSNILKYCSKILTIKNNNIEVEDKFNF